MGNASVQLSWTASTGSPYGYYVQQSSDGVTFSTVQTVTTTSAVVSGLFEGKTYYFRIQAYNQGGTSSYTTNTVINIPIPSPTRARLQSNIQLASWDLASTFYV